MLQKLRSEKCIEGMLLQVIMYTCIGKKKIGVVDHKSTVLFTYWNIFIINSQYDKTKKFLPWYG